jgi:photosystem II stability/assembly factor-like uncharacterized protein
LISKDAAETTPGGWKTELSLSRESPFIRGSPLPTGTLYYFYSDTVQVLQRTGSTWSVSRTRKLLLTITEIYPSTERVGECWAVTRDGGGKTFIAHTADDWATFVYLGGEGLTGPIFSLIVRPFNSREMYAAGQDGVLQTTDGGRSWKRFDTGLPKVQARVLRYLLDTQFQGNDRLVLATFGRGLYECAVPGPAIVYVDGTCLTCPGDGSFEHPFGILAQGIVQTPSTGILALRGGGDYYLTAPLQSPMTINAYAGPAILQAIPQGSPQQVSPVQGLNAKK